MTRVRQLLSTSLYMIALLAAACSQNGSNAAPSASASSPPPPASASAPEVAPGPSATAAPTSVATAAQCPPLTQPDRVAATDWAKDFGVAGDLTTTVHTTLGIASETRALATEIEAELLPACASMAALLGGKTGQAHAEVACQAAADALRTARTKLGPTAKVSLAIHEPACPMALEVVDDCSGHCGDAKGAGKCQGGEIGRCDGECNGTCELRGPSTCDGTCDGKCESFTGTCVGTCKGKCNGADMKAGSCAGKCEGSCEGVAKGTCKGPCAGGCQGKLKTCGGTCLGACSKTMSDVRCGDVAKPEGASPECTDYCETRGTRKAVCTPAIVNVTVTGAKDETARAAFENAIERNLPAVLRAERHLRNRLDVIQKNGDVVTNGLKAISKGDAGKVEPCIVGAEKDVTEGVTTLKEDYAAAKNVLGVVGAK